MSRTISIFIFAMCLLVAAGCKKDKSPSTTELRILNATPWIFYDCTVDPTGTVSDNPGVNAYNFGQVNLNEKSSYKTFTSIYHYAWVRLTMNNKTYYIKPYDYTTETVLESGQYTYKLTYSNAYDNLGLELIKD